MKLEVFFDYICPFCYRGHKNLLNLKARYPQLEVIWRPCESHPRPEWAPIHSDMAIQGMYFIRDHQGDLWHYHDLAFGAVFERQKDISNLDQLAAMSAECGVDPDAFKAALSENRYGKEVEDGNRCAWGEHGLTAVPSYLSGSHFIGSQNGVLVTEKELDEFIAGLL